MVIWGREKYCYQSTSGFVDSMKMQLSQTIQFSLIRGLLM